MTTAEAAAIAKQIGISVQKITVYLPAGLTEPGYMITCACGFRRGPHTNPEIVRRLFRAHLRNCPRRTQSHPPTGVATPPEGDPAR